MRRTKKPSWYTARCHFRSDTPGKRKFKAQLWEESFFLVRAISRKHAERRATELARKRKRTYTNFAGDVVTWRFADLIDVHPVADMEFREGTQVYSGFFAHKNPPRLAKARG
jgi:hypothetical protein